MTTPSQPRLKLSKLRDIGWTLWDPIGLLSTHGPFEGHWSDAANHRVADEYDNYLISAASRLREGAPAEAVAAYLVWVETEHMRMPGGPETRARAEAVIAAILADPDIWTWADAQGRFA